MAQPAEVCVYTHIHVDSAHIFVYTDIMCKQAFK